MKKSTLILFLLFCWGFGFSQIRFDVLYDSKTTIRGDYRTFLYGKHSSDASSFFHGIHFRQDSIYLGSDTAFLADPIFFKSLLYKVNRVGKMEWARVCNNTNNSGIISASVIKDKVYLVYFSQQQAPIGLFDGTTLPSIHKLAVFLSVLESNGDVLFTKEIAHTDSVMSYFYGLPQITANDAGEIFICGNVMGHWDFQGYKKNWLPRKNFYNQDIWQFFVTKYSSNGTLVWINDSISQSYPDRPEMLYSELNRQLVIGQSFSDTLKFENGKIFVAKDPVIASGKDNFALALNDSGGFIWSTHFNSGFAVLSAINPNPDSTYNFTISTAGEPLKVNGNSMPYNGYVYVVELNKDGNATFVHGGTSKNYNYIVAEKNGLNGSKFFQYYSNSISYLLGDSSISEEDSAFNTCIWWIKDNVILNKIQFSHPKRVFAEFVFQDKDYSYFTLYYRDTCEINGKKLTIDTNYGHTTFIRIPNTYMSGIEVPKKDKLKMATQLNLYPNPAQSKVTATFHPANNAPTQINIADGMGNVLKTYSAPAFVNAINMDIAELKPGLYFVLFDNKYWKEGRTLLIKE